MPPEASPWSYDLSARVYDDDMAASAPPGDVEYYVARCLSRSPRVLELGAGTGRITLPLLASGKNVTAVDRSEPMLRVLSEKAAAAVSTADRGRLTVLCADMRELPALDPFGTVLCPYSAFTYLVTDEDRSRALSRVRALLPPDGMFILDVFVPDPAIKTLADDHVFFDYRRERPDGTVLERSKVIRKDVEPNVNELERRYEIRSSSGEILERFSTRSKIRYWYPDDLRRELMRHGFHVTHIADFGLATGTREKTAVFECTQ